jgi:hypothetical protein
MLLPETFHAKYEEVNVDTGRGPGGMSFLTRRIGIAFLKNLPSRNEKNRAI